MTKIPLAWIKSEKRKEEIESSNESIPCEWHITFSYSGIAPNQPYTRQHMCTSNEKKKLYCVHNSISFLK